jgi:23S rRNA (adenine2030-N6)-methyltransferase
MNYRHAYHAGNFADVFKHALLVCLIEALKHKQTPFCYLDTHAGIGRYDLRSDAARKTGEADSGILRVLSPHAHDGETVPESGREQRMPALLHVYLNLVRSQPGNPATGGELVTYPGSPCIALDLMRDQDRAVLCELHPEDAAELRRVLRDDPRAAVHERDGYAALKALLPPKEKRGLVLIDPPFEAQAREFGIISNALADGLRKWPNGVYAVWYPIKLREDIQGFHRWLRECSAQKVLVAELLMHPDNSSLRLNGCGLAILNPPWRIEQAMGEVLGALKQRLSPGRYARWELTWLKQENAR